MFLSVYGNRNANLFVGIHANKRGDNGKGCLSVENTILDILPENNIFFLFCQ